jgi:hypothetical protein
MACAHRTLGEQEPLGRSSDSEFACSGEDRDHVLGSATGTTARCFFFLFVIGSVRYWRLLFVIGSLRYWRE